MGSPQEPHQKLITSPPDKFKAKLMSGRYDNEEASIVNDRALIEAIVQDRLTRIPRIQRPITLPERVWRDDRSESEKTVPETSPYCCPYSKYRRHFYLIRTGRRFNRRGQGPFRRGVGRRYMYRRYRYRYAHAAHAKMPDYLKNSQLIL